MSEPATLARLMRVDVVAGVFVTAAAVLVFSGSAGLSMGELRNFGPGFLPRVFSVALLCCGLALLVKGFAQAGDDEEPLRFAARGPLMVGLAIFVFAFTINGAQIGPIGVPEFGLLLAGPIVVMLAGLGTSEARPRELMALGIGLTGFMTLIFVDLLHVTLPVFPVNLDDALPHEWGRDWPVRIAAIAWTAIGLAIASSLRNTRQEVQ